MSELRTMIVAAAAVVATACAGIEVIGPDPVPLGSERLVEGQVRVSLTVTPDAVNSPGTVIAKLTYENLGNEVAVLGSSYGCLSFGSVYLGEDRIPFPATQYGCTAAASYRDLAPGASLTVQWPMVIGGENGMSVPAGTYRFVAELNTHSVSLERTFVVR